MIIACSIYPEKVFFLVQLFKLIRNCFFKNLLFFQFLKFKQLFIKAREIMSFLSKDEFLNYFLTYYKLLLFGHVSISTDLP